MILELDDPLEDEEDPCRKLSTRLSPRQGVSPDQTQRKESKSAQKARSGEKSKEERRA